ARKDGPQEARRADPHPLPALPPDQPALPPPPRGRPREGPDPEPAPDPRPDRRPVQGGAGRALEQRAVVLPQGARVQHPQEEADGEDQARQEAGARQERERRRGRHVDGRGGQLRALPDQHGHHVVLLQGLPPRPGHDALRFSPAGLRGADAEHHGADHRDGPGGRPRGLPDEDGQEPQAAVPDDHGRALPVPHGGVRRRRPALQRAVHPEPRPVRELPRLRRRAEHPAAVEKGDRAA
ncbi:hypothetical protein THAOC_18100, partial [Thalassiosira oceanica]